MKRYRQLVYCVTCGAELDRPPSLVRKHNFCSVGCKSEWHRKQVGSLCPNWKGGPVLRYCLACGAAFGCIKSEATTDSRRKFCSRSCYQRSRSGSTAGGWKGGLYIGNERSYNRARDEWRRNQIRMLGTFTEAEWRMMKQLHAYRCVGCYEVEPNIRLVRDHIVPVSRGGTNEWENIQPLCGKCNGQKHAKTIFFVEGFQVVDAARVPRELLKPSLTKINAAIAAGIRAIPGIDIFQATQQSA